jgi:hypothetical protein
VLLDLLLLLFARCCPRKSVNQDRRDFIPILPRIFSKFHAKFDIRRRSRGHPNFIVADDPTLVR